MPRAPIHPGEHRAEERRGLNMSAAELAHQRDVPVNRVTQILNGHRSVTADTALHLGHWFGTGPEISLNLQQIYELCHAAPKPPDARTASVASFEYRFVCSDAHALRLPLMRSPAQSERLLSRCLLADEISVAQCLCVNASRSRNYSRRRRGVRSAITQRHRAIEISA